MGIFPPQCHSLMIAYLMLSIIPPSTKVIARDIYNIKKKISKKKLNGRSMVQVLFEELGKA
ncbi:hypothetical protein OROGR_024745 [Orobanche gracilis]